MKFCQDIKTKGKERHNVAKYVLKRVLYAVLTILFLIAITFVMMQLLPGSPFVGDKAVDPLVLEALNAKYGLDKPIYEQFVRYMANVLQGDLGTDLQTKRPIVQTIMESFPYSFELGLRALIFAAIMGVLLGVVAAVKHGTKWDTITMLIALIGISVPSFIMGALLQYFLGLKLFQWTGVRIFPIMGWNTEASKLLPSFALSFGSLASISRIMRTSMMDVMSSDYIKTAKAKGLGRAKIVVKHAVRNAILPVVTLLGPQAAALLTGAFVVENIFSIPGMGRYFVIGVQSNNYPMIAGTTLFYGAFLVVANLVVDLLYGVIDPRVKLTGGKE